jgi:hypothetical protein
VIVRVSRFALGDLARLGRGHTTTCEPSREIQGLRNDIVSGSLTPVAAKRVAQAVAVNEIGQGRANL